MTAATLTVVGIAAALVNWWSRLREHGRRTAEAWSKPVVTACVIGLAALAEDVPAKHTWFVVAFTLCLLGDVLLLWPAGFLPGLVAFAAAHVAFMVGMLATSDLPGAGSKAVVIVAVVVLLAVVAPRVIAGAAGESGMLAVATAVYVVVIATMAVVAAVRGSDKAAAGAVAFVVSDALLGWSRFVTRFRWDRLAVMVTYHLALAGLVASMW